jgi:hypothetical protein
VAVGDAIHERDDDVQAGFQRPVVFAEPLDDPCRLMGHDLDCLKCQNDRKDSQSDDEYIHAVLP